MVLYRGISDDEAALASVVGHLVHASAVPMSHDNEVMELVGRTDPDEIDAELPWPAQGTVNLTSDPENAAGYGTVAEVDVDPVNVYDWGHGYFQAKDPRVCRLIRILSP